MIPLQTNQDASSALLLDSKAHELISTHTPIELYKHGAYCF